MLGFRPPPPLHEIGARRGGHKRLRKKQAPLQDNTPADVKKLLLVLGGFLLALFVVTKMALGL